ncbi:NADP-dependent oxidoreductase domain-containing protein [Aspergillus cavernicola]|uniref:NADP-dependent oxidoreductase domain-containing protein n=1 Tax=Aspergillus cavernicola TaxID=176166 RepID=A0ABR4HJH4_9EURO
MKSVSNPRIILGLMTTGPDVDTGARITSLGDFKQMLGYFQGEGYIEIDTARVYSGGKQEAFTAQAGWKDRGLKLATKWYPLQPGFHKPEVVREKLNESLRELGTDSVDIFYLHAPDRSVPFAETLGEVDKLHREDKFKQLGLSNYTAYEVAEIVTMCHGSGVARSIETELIPACRRYGLDIVIYNPIAAGLLAGRYKTAENPQEGRYSSQNPTAQNYRDRYFTDSAFEAVKVINAAADKHGLTMAECAFRWLRHHSGLRMGTDGNDGVVIGVSSLAQLENNLRDLEKSPLPDDVVEAFNEAWMLTKSTTVVYWHKELEYAYDTQKVLFG